MTLRRRMTVALVMIISVVVALELLLRVFDPLGVNTYYSWLVWSIDTRIDHPTGYSYQEGMYDVAGYNVTIDDNGNRALPARDNARCTIALIGDSVTFGIGVDDEDTFAWHLARTYPDVQFINTGKSGYDSENLSDSINYFEADAYLYTIVNNDTSPPARYSPVEFDNRIVLQNYLLWFAQQNYTDDHLPDLYADVLTAFEDKPVLFVSAGEHLAYELAQERFEVLLLPETERVSVADGHPDAGGHAEIANFLMPHIATLIDNHC